MDAVKILPRYTYSDYLHWEGKWEVIDGIPFAMSPTPAPLYQQIAANLATEFSISLKSCRKHKVYLPIDYLLEDDTILQPDLLIVCNEITKKFLDFPPVLVVEILSPSTALKDRHTKYKLYQQQGIKYYVIVDPDTKEAEVYSLNDGSYLLHEKGADFVYEFALQDCIATVNFGSIW